MNKLKKWWKYWKLLALFKDAATAYKEECAKEKTEEECKNIKVPIILHRRVYGAGLVAIAGFLTIQWGVDLGDIGTLTNSIEQLIAAAVVIYGVVAMVVGQIKSKRNG